MRTLRPLGGEGEEGVIGEASGERDGAMLLVAEAQFPDQNPWAKQHIKRPFHGWKISRRSCSYTHSARAVLECPRVSFVADEIRLIRPINVLNIVAAVATDDHLARLHGGLIPPHLPYHLSRSLSLSLSYPCRRY